jgi:hypothetical protein
MAENLLGVLILGVSIIAGYFGWRLPDMAPEKAVRVWLA